MNSTSVNSVKTEAITLYSHTRRINRGNWGTQKKRVWKILEMHMVFSGGLQFWKKDAEFTILINLIQSILNKSKVLTLFCKVLNCDFWESSPKMTDSAAL